MAAVDDTSEARAVLRAAGLPADGVLEARHGGSNRAWLGPSLVVRISSGRLRGSFTHEAHVTAALADCDSTVPLPRVLTHGSFGDGEWIVTRRMPGVTLAEAWPATASGDRRRVGVQVGQALRALHSAPVRLEPPWWVDSQSADSFHNAYRPPVTLTPVMLEAARSLDGADDGLIDEVASLLAGRLGLFAADVAVFTHADVHGHNLLVNEGRLSAILDWEGAHPAPADVELDMFLRWCDAAHEFPERPGARTTLAPGALRVLADHVREGYPELFASPRLRERLEVYEVQWNLVQLFFDAWWCSLGNPSGASKWWKGLQAVLDETTHLASFDL